MNTVEMAIVHDFFRGIEGGEKLVLTLAQAWNIPIFTGEVDSVAQKLLLNSEKLVVNLDFLRKGPFLLSFSQIIKFWWGFSRILPAVLKDIPKIFFSGQLAPLGAPRLSGYKILYCHTPPRILYDAKNFYLSQMPFSKRLFMKILLRWYRFVYENALKKIDIILANSQNVRKRIKTFLGYESEIVHPPVDTKKFRWIAQEGFFLSTARLDPLKRVDLIVQTFLELPERNLVVISGGPLYKKICCMTENAPNIKVLGWVSEEKLCDLIGRCLATIYIPKDEDFGISPVEAMAAGKPVIGVAEGGLKETIVNGETGFLLKPNPTKEDLKEAIYHLTPSLARSMLPACKARAHLFDKEIFLKRISDIISSV